jgi:predicted aspartyl protease
MPETKCGFDTVADGANGSDLLVQVGPTLLVSIGFDPQWKGLPNLPIPGLRDIRALVDTGATESCIDSLLAAKLNLPIVDKRGVSGIHGTQEVRIHLAQVHVPSLGFTLYGAFAGVHLAAGGQPHMALIGRTFLRRYTMVYEGKTGTVTLSSD